MAAQTNPFSSPRLQAAFDQAIQAIREDRTTEAAAHITEIATDGDDQDKTFLLEFMRAYTA